MIFHTPARDIKPQQYTLYLLMPRPFNIVFISSLLISSQQANCTSAINARAAKHFIIFVCSVGLNFY